MDWASYDSEGMRRIWYGVLRRRLQCQFFKNKNGSKHSDRTRGVNACAKGEISRYADPPAIYVASWVRIGAARGSGHLGDPPGVEGGPGVARSSAGPGPLAQFGPPEGFAPSSAWCSPGAPGAGALASTSPSICVEGGSGRVGLASCEACVSGIC